MHAPKFVRRMFLTLLVAAGAVAAARAQESDWLIEHVEHGYAQNGDVKIHYVAVGEGPLLVMLHGFPDYWYTWREQIMALKDDFRIVALDLRGYNLSDQPKGVEHYAMPRLMDDVVAVIRAQGEDRATVIGHDWGGAIAWQLAIRRPEVVERLVVCNMTHPTGYRQASLAALQANGNESYMDTFRKHTAETLPVSWLCGWVKDPEAKRHYEAAFRRSCVDCMLDYYRANTETRDQRAEWLKAPEIPAVPRVDVPVLAIFGTRDQFVDKRGLNNTWDWLGKDFTLVTAPDAGHFVQQDAAGLVSRSMKMWLLRDREQATGEAAGKAANAAALKRGKPESGNAAGPLAEFDWLVGTWQRTSRQEQAFEAWKKVGPSTYAGRGFSLDPDSGERAVSEEILLTAMGGEVFYIPKTPGNSLPVPFRLVSGTGGKWVFENPDHDFPQRIEYEFSGRDQPSGKDRLTATISDMSRKKVIPFVFVRE